jgi:hypothetical protein
LKSLQDQSLKSERPQSQVFATSKSIACLG